MGLGGKAGSAARKAGDGAQFPGGQLRRAAPGFQVRQQLAHRAAAEDIARAGRVDDADARRAFHRGAGPGVGGKAAFGAQRRIDQLHAVFGQQLLRARFGRKAPQKVDLFVADLDHVGLAQPPFDLLFGVGLAFPQRFAQVGVKADELAFFLRVGHGLLRGRAGGLAGQAQSSEMEHPRFVDEGFVHLLRRQAGVGAGLARKAELPVAGGVQRHKGQRCEHGRVGHDAARLDAFFGRRAHQQPAETVRPHFAEQRGPAAVFLQRGQKVARRAARLGLQRGVACGVGGDGGKVDEQFA